MDHHGAIQGQGYGYKYNYRMDNYAKYFSANPPFLGKYQRILAITIFVLFQTMLYVFGLLPIYAMITLNYKLLTILILISALQSLVGKSQAFISFVIDTLQLHRYSSSYNIFYEEKIKQNERCIFGTHPHGVLSVGIITNMHLKDGPFKNVVGLSSRAMLFVPVVGLFLRLWDVQSVDSKHMKRLMKEGRNISLMPGGFEEATLTTPKELRVYIMKRKGFIKYAMESNYSIYPTICMQEHQAFWTFDHLKSFRLWLNKWKVPAIIFFNPTSLFFLPPKIDFCTIVGKKMQYRPISPGQSHTNSEIEVVHSAYMNEIQRIYQKYRHLNSNVPLKFY